MKSEGCLGTLKFMAVRLAIAQIIVFALTGAICWFIGLRTVAEYSTGLILAGLAVMFFGASTVMNGATLNSDFRHQYSKTVMPNSANQRMQQNVSDLADISFTVWAGLTGFITTLLGIVIEVFIYI